MRTPDELFEIRQAIDALPAGEADGVWNEEWFKEGIAPLLNAIRDGDHESIVAAMGGKMLTDLERRKEEVQTMAWYVSRTPEAFGAKELSKAEIIAILRAGFPHYDEVIPTSKSGLAIWWNEVDATAGQLHGNEDPNVARWIRKVSEAGNISTDWNEVYVPPPRGSNSD